MKKPKLSSWKKRKKRSFYFWFILYVNIIVISTVAIANWTAENINPWLRQYIDIPDVIVLIGLSLLIGIVLSIFIGKFVLAPIKRIRNAMTDVSSGNFDTAVSEESRFDEVEDINHAFNIMVKELRSTEIIQSDFISNVSHEFKTPLSAIEGYTTMLQAEDLTEEEKKEYTDKILFNTKRMSELVQNILLLSKLDNQGIEGKKEEFSVDEQIRQEILATETKWEKKNLEFDIQMDALSFTGNKNIISQMWGNLIGNAIKFSPIGGKITIELKKQSKSVYFAISDEGEGIKDSEKERVFNKFYQADSSHKQEGNGLGLALVKKIVDLYGGNVNFENLDPKGCKFIVQLPTE